MGTHVHGVEALPTLGWVEGGAFTPLDNITMKSFMDFPVPSWEDDFNDRDRVRYTNLKCLLPSGRILPGLVPIVREFGRNWPPHWRTLVCKDGRRSFRVENIVERDGILQAFDIDPTPHPSFSPQPALVTSVTKHAIHYGGWTDDTYIHVVPPGCAGVKVNVMAGVVEELDGVTYDVQFTPITCVRGLPQGVRFATSDDVRIYTWNCRGIPRATFRPNLFTLTTMTNSSVVVLTETRACDRNAQQVLRHARGMNYLYTETLGFEGGVSILWYMSKVFLYGFHIDAKHVLFVVKVMTLRLLVFPCYMNAHY